MKSTNNEQRSSDTTCHRGGFSNLNFHPCAACPCHPESRTAAFPCRPAFSAKRTTTQRMEPTQQLWAANMECMFIIKQIKQDTPAITDKRPTFYCSTQYKGYKRLSAEVSIKIPHQTHSKAYPEFSKCLQRFCLTQTREYKCFPPLYKLESGPYI